MTAFWIIQLRVATFQFQHDVNNGQAPGQDDFRSVLLHMPSLLYGRLWSFYYSKTALFAPAARDKFVMPDLQPFPQVTRTLADAIAQGQDDVAGGESMPMLPEDPNALVGPERLPRWALAVVQNVLKSSLRRGAALKEGLAALQTDTIKLRAHHPQLAGTGAVQPYSETQAYVWVQLVHARLGSIAMAAQKGAQGKTALGEENVEDMAYGTFREVCGITGLEWQAHYSEDLWYSMEARLKFVNPDKAPLLDVLKVG